jgi:CBS domain-containing protein
MQVEQIMNREVKTCGPHEPLNKAAQIMWDTPCGAVPVVDNQGRPVGFLTDRDVCMAAYTQGKPLAELQVRRGHGPKACLLPVRRRSGFSGPAYAAEPYSSGTGNRPGRGIGRPAHTR